MGQTQLLPRFSELNSRKQRVAPTEREPETNTAGQIQEAVDQGTNHLGDK